MSEFHVLYLSLLPGVSAVAYNFNLKPHSRYSAALALYAVLLIWLATLRPLWLDEVLTLIGAAKPTLHELLTWVGYNPGSSPLGFLTERPFIETFGLTRLGARLPSILFSVASGVVLLGFARDLKLRSRALLLAAYLVLPIQLRYAVEARPYAAALFLTVAALWCLWRLLNRPSLSLAVLYALLVATGLYVQPFAAFVQVGALAALAFSSRRDAVLVAAAALAAGCLLFAPWYWHVRIAWQREIAGSGYPEPLVWRTPLVLIREIAGGGYWQSIPLLIGAWLGWNEIAPRARRFLLGVILCGAVGAMAADAVSGYFFATRHALFVIPALAALASAGFGANRYRRAGAALGAIFFVACAAKGGQYFRGGSEDWPGAARAMLDQARQGTCIIVPPPEPEDLYALFEPMLGSHFCTVASASGVAAITATGYSIPARLKETQTALAARGFHLTEEKGLPGAVRLLIYRVGTPAPAP